MAEQSLSRLLEQQIQSQEDTNDAIKALNKQFTNYFKVLERQKLPSEESRRERGLFGRMLGGGSQATKKAEEEGSSLFGGLFAGVFKSLSGTFGFILKPLRLLAKLLIRGGPIGIVLGLMYTVFKDIGDNPAFQKSLESLKETWERVKTGFLDLKETISELTADIDLAPTITKVTEWFGRLKKNLQDFVGETLENALVSINGVIDTIGSIFEGDLKGAFDGFKNVAKGLIGIVDSLVTNILETFGVNFGEDGSFLGMITGIFDRLLIRVIGMWNATTDWIKEKWNNITTSISNFFTDITTFFTTTIPTKVIEIQAAIKDKANELRDAVINFVTDTWQLIKSYIPNPAEIARNLRDKVMAIAPDWLKDWLAERELDNRQTYYEQGLERGRGNFDVTAQGMDDYLQQSRLRFRDTGQIITGVRADATGALQVEAESYAKRFASTFGAQNINIGQLGDVNQSTVATSTSGGKASADLGRAIDYYHLEKRLGGGFYGFSVSDLRLMR